MERHGDGGKTMPAKVAPSFTPRLACYYVVSLAAFVFVLCALSRRRRDFLGSGQYDDDGATKILLLSSNGRSGSTYLSELLSPSSAGAVSFFEPLKWASNPPRLTRTELEMASDEWRRRRDGAESSGKLEMVEDLLRCELDKHEDLVWAFETRNKVFKGSREAFPLESSPDLVQTYKDACSSSDLRVLKTVRLHLDELFDGFHGFSPAFANHLKVLVLVRDPRAVIASVQSAPDPAAEWGASGISPDVACGHILRDLDSLDDFRLASSAGAVVIRYEDLVEDPEWQLRVLLNFVGRGDDDVLERQLMEGVREHTVAERNPSGHFKSARERNSKRTEEGVYFYYDTRRTPDFRHDGWKDTLSAERIGEIQENAACREAMDRMGYEIWEQQEEEEESQ